MMNKDIINNFCFEKNTLDDMLTLLFLVLHMVEVWNNTLNLGFKQIFKT